MSNDRKAKSGTRVTTEKRTSSNSNRKETTLPCPSSSDISLTPSEATPLIANNVYQYRRIKSTSEWTGRSGISDTTLIVCNNFHSPRPLYSPSPSVDVSHCSAISLSKDKLLTSTITVAVSASGLSKDQFVIPSSSLGTPVQEILVATLMIDRQVPNL